MTKTLRVLGFGPLLQSVATAPAFAGPAAPAERSSRAVASPASGRRAGKGTFNPLFFLGGLDLAETFSISPYGLA